MSAVLFLTKNRYEDTGGREAGLPDRVHDILKVLHRYFPPVGLVFEHLVRQSRKYSPKRMRIPVLEPSLCMCALIDGIDVADLAQKWCHRGIVSFSIIALELELCRNTVRFLLWSTNLEARLNGCWGRKELCRRQSLELKKTSVRLLSTARRCSSLFTHANTRTSDLLPVCTYGRVSVLISVCIKIKIEFHIRDGVFDIPITPLHSVRTLSDE